MILIYHPDKMKSAAEDVQEVNDEIFKSIQKGNHKQTSKIETKN